MGKLRDKIMNAQDMERELVEIPEWGVTIEVRSMTGAQRARLLKNSGSGGEIDIEKLYPDMIIECSFEPDTGERVFEAADRETLAGKNSKHLEKLAKAAMRLSGLDDDAVKEAKKN